MSNLISRREFLQLLGLGSFSLATVSLDREGYGSSKQKSVVVIGGGLSGLCCAYELRRRGIKVLAVLEAQGRIGGRVFTMRPDAKDRQYIEMGATRIADTHAHTLAYAEEFRLPLKEIPTDEPSLYGIQGRFFTHQEGTAWPNFLKMGPNERNLGSNTLMMKYEKLEQWGNPQRADWPPKSILSSDALTLREYFQREGMTEDEIALVQAIHGSEINRESALYWLMTEVVDAKWNKTYAIAGGNDQLPLAFARSLGTLVKRGCVVKTIQQEADGITVGWEEAGLRKTIFADQAICAIPFSTLRNIRILPTLPDEKTQVIQTLRMMPVARCTFQTKTRFWQNRKLGGLNVVRTDSQVERIWDLSRVQEGVSGMITAYLQDRNALDLGAMPVVERLPWIKSHIATFWPEVDTEAIGGWHKLWHTDPWAKGAWSCYEPNELGWMFPLAKRREGRLFFCGEHTSPWSGWMQGALESAHRVVAEMIG